MRAQLRDTLIASLEEIAKDEAWDRERVTVLATQDCTDRQYAGPVAAAAGLTHHVIDVTLSGLLEELPTCMQVLKTFDPMELRNNIAVCRALREAAGLGFTCAVTGDGADELFGGYNFTHKLEERAWLESRRRTIEVMHFGSATLGRHFGVHVASPYLSPAIVQAALKLSKQDCVREHDGRVLGKWPLRLACPEVLTCWRTKDPIEVGCGSTMLGDRPWLPSAPPGYFHEVYSDGDFERGQRAAAEEGVEIRDREHLHYYQVFRTVFPGGEVLGKPRFGSDPCPKCHYQLSHPQQTFCVTCGHYDPQLRDRHQATAGAPPL
ncbi:hypothetical protein N2152v2_003934 [Parachlorella kessleri]